MVYKTSDGKFIYGIENLFEDLPRLKEELETRKDVYYSRRFVDNEARAVYEMMEKDLNYCVVPAMKAVYESFLSNLKKHGLVTDVLEDKYVIDGKIVSIKHDREPEAPSEWGRLGIAIEIESGNKKAAEKASDVLTDTVNKLKSLTVDEVLKLSRRHAKRNLEYLYKPLEELQNCEPLSAEKLRAEIVDESILNKVGRIKKYVVGRDGWDVGNGLCKAYRDHIIGTRDRNWGESKKKMDGISFWRYVQEILPTELKFSQEEIERIGLSNYNADGFAVELSFSGHSAFSQLGTEFHARK